MELNVDKMGGRLSYDYVLAALLLQSNRRWTLSDVLLLFILLPLLLVTISKFWFLASG